MSAAASSPQASAIRCPQGRESSNRVVTPISGGSRMPIHVTGPGLRSSTKSWTRNADPAAAARGSTSIHSSASRRPGGNPAATTAPRTVRSPEKTAP